MSTAEEPMDDAHVPNTGRKKMIIGAALQPCETVQWTDLNMSIMLRKLSRQQPSPKSHKTDNFKWINNPLEE